MGDDLLKHLEDIRAAGHAVLDFTAGKSECQYAVDELLQSAVERKFEIIGEALSRIGRADPSALGRIREHRQIISFRNILAHGYDAVDDLVVWAIVTNDLPHLLDDVERLSAHQSG